MKKITFAIAAAIACGASSAAQITLPNTGATLSFSDGLVVKSIGNIWYGNDMEMGDRVLLVAEVSKGISDFFFSLSSATTIYSASVFQMEVLKYSDGFRSGNYKFSANTIESTNFGNATVSFTPGTWLLPSDDADCASVLCMTPIKDRAFISFSVFAGSVSAIPEPSGYLLLAASLGAAGVISARRRSHQA
jgi:hypothetical protein